MKILGTSRRFACNIVERDMEDRKARSDGELLRRFASGDREAFTALYRAHSPAIFRFALYMTGDRVMAAELTQDVFVWLVRHPAEFDAGRGELPSFLGGVARRILQRRKETARRWLPLEEAAMPAGGTEFARGLEQQDELAELRKAIAALPERYRETVVLCDLQEKSYQQAADELACAVGTVRSRLHRARELLARKFLGKKESQKC
jgi:RNA polymerase sigma-70 factor, ECF subfamily